MSKITINDRCPLQSECGRKHCEYQLHERDCSYYQGNARPDAEIENQTQAMEAEWEAKMSDKSVLDETSAPAAPQETESETVWENNNPMVLLPVDCLHPHPDNPRKELGDLTELAESIKVNGVFQNLTVVPLNEDEKWMALAKQYREQPTEELRTQMNQIAHNKVGDTPREFRVIIGHRRLAAAKLAGLTEVPCVITIMTYKEQIQTMLLENMQRSDLTVYEQAQGFQMMLDLGSTVEEIAEKSGFSKTTVRRRVKMMELNQDTLKEVSARPLSLSDFDELSKIEDVTARNACLSEIGTSNFKQNVATQLRKQAIKKNLPAVKKLLIAAKAKALKQNDTWSNKYENVGEYSYNIAEWKEGEPLIPEKVFGQLYYYLEEAYGTIRFFQERKKAKPVKRPAAEIEKEKRIAAAWSGVNEKAAVTYHMRKDFIQGLTWTQKTAEAILQGALIAGVLKTIDYMSSDREAMEKALGLEEKTSYGSDRGIKALAALQKLDVKQIPSAIYALFYDSAKESYASGHHEAYPKYQKSTKLDGLYLWLTSLGYQMSDEEKALQDGTHELYHKGDLTPQTDKEEHDE